MKKRLTTKNNCGDNLFSNAEIRKMIPTLSHYQLVELIESRMFNKSDLNTENDFHFALISAFFQHVENLPTDFLRLICIKFYQFIDMPSRRASNEVTE